MIVMRSEIGEPARFIHAYRRRHQWTDVVFPLVSLLRRAAEWNLPLWIASLDVAAAFDHMSAEGVAEHVLMLLLANCQTITAQQEGASDAVKFGGSQAFQY